MRKYKLFSERSSQSLDGYCEAIKYTESFFKRLFNIDIFICYGTLLGAIRANDFIPHDYDVDLSYVSQHDNLEDIALESSNILTKIMMGEIANVKFYSGNFAQYKFHVTNEHGKFIIEIFLSYFINNSFKHYYTIHDGFRIDDIFPYNKVRIRQHQFNAPYNIDRYLTSQYGVNWRVPDPNFIEDKNEINFKPFIPLLPQLHLAAWNKYYKINRKTKSDINHSALDLVKQNNSLGQLLDIGCGLGVESVYFGSHSKSVIGIDYSQHAIELASNYAQNSHNVQIQKLPLSALKSVTTFINNYKSSFNTIYCSNILNSINSATENILFYLIEACLSEEGTCLLEYSTNQTLFTKIKSQMLYNRDISYSSIAQNLAKYNLTTAKLSSPPIQYRSSEVLIIKKNNRT